MQDAREMLGACGTHDAFIADLHACCVDGTREFVHGAGFTDCVIGLSGGIDSGLVAAIAAQALGAQHVHGVLLPGPYSSDHSISDALDLAQRLGISTCTMSVDEPYQAFERVLCDSGDEGIFAGHAPKLTGITAQNVQARCRMVVLMALSNEHRWMMLNTGNRTEAFMGYSTLYGDMAGAYAPIGGLWKTQVFAMARWLNARAEAAAASAFDERSLSVQGPIPRHMIEKPPSAELAEGQTDEESLGIAYADLDRILVAHVDDGLTREELLSAGFAASQVDLVLHRMAASAFKRALEPPCPNII